MSTAAKAAANPRHKLRSGGDLRTGYLLLAPWLFGFIFMYLVPAVMSIYYSFTFCPPPPGSACRTTSRSSPRTPISARR